MLSPQIMITGAAAVPVEASAGRDAADCGFNRRRLVLRVLDTGRPQRRHRMIRSLVWVSFWVADRQLLPASSGVDG